MTCKAKNIASAAEQYEYSQKLLTGAVWCDTEKYPQWKTLPDSFFECTCNPDNHWKHSLLEFRFFYEWDGKTGCTLDFSACCRFRLLINGVFVEDGPVEAGGDYGKTDAPDWWFGDSRKIDRWLSCGINEVRFQLVPIPIVQSDYTAGYGWVWGMLHDKNGSYAPEKWQFRISRNYNLCSWVDSEENAVAWLDDCVPVQVHHPVYFMGLPPLTDKKITSFKYLFPFGKADNVKVHGKKLLVKPGRPATLFLALPQMKAGNFEVHAHGSFRVKMFIEFQELYGIKPDQNAVEYFFSKPGKSSYRTFRIYPCKYIKVDLIPSGFFTESDADEPVTLEFCFYERSWKFGRKQSIRKFPQPWMKTLDDHCLNLLKLCMQRIHLDSPAHHEGLGCTGDYRIGANIAALAYHETRLAKADLFRTTLLLRQQKKMFHTSYELCFILMMQEYFERTSDKDFIRACYDAVLIVFDHFKKMTGQEGLISQAENYLFIDWAVDGDITYHHPPAGRGMTAMTALWYGALQAMQKIAENINKSADAKKFSAEAVCVRNAFNQLLRDEETGTYVDGIPGLSEVPPNQWLPADDSCRISSNIGNIMALAFGLPESHHQPEKLLQKIIAGELPVKPTIYYMEYLFMAACRYHLPMSDKVRLLSLWKPFMKEGIRESWIAGDYSHMWSASPAYWMRKKEFFSAENSELQNI